MRRHLIAAAGAFVLSSNLTGCERLPAPAQRDAPASAAIAPATVTLVPPGPERPPAGPRFLFPLRAGVFGIADTIAGRVVFIDPTGRPLGAAALPGGFRPVGVDLSAGVVLRGDRREVAIPADVELAGARPLADRPLTASRVIIARRGDSLQFRFSRSGVMLDIAPFAGGRVETATFLGRDAGGHLYVYAEEADDEGAVRAFVGRFGEDGERIATGEVILSGDGAPPTLPAALADDGAILVLSPGAREIELLRLVLQSGRSGKGASRRVGSAPANVLDLGDVEIPPAPARLEGRAAPPPWDAPRADAILARARAFQTAKWMLRPANYRQSAIANRCDKTRRAYWLRPNRFKTSDINREMTSLPYKWGGFDSVERFVQKINGPDPHLAGDVCTCRDTAHNQCLTPRSAGVDCSGFVSRAWGLRQHTGTSSLPSISARLPGLADLKPGDIVNYPGSHVRLVVRLEPGPELRVRTLESAVSCGGICEDVYTPLQLARYVPRRIIQ